MWKLTLTGLLAALLTGCIHAKQQQCKYKLGCDAEGHPIIFRGIGG